MRFRALVLVSLRGFGLSNNFLFRSLLPNGRARNPIPKTFLVTVIVTGKTYYAKTLAKQGPLLPQGPPKSPKMRRVLGFRVGGFIGLIQEYVGCIGFRADSGIPA